MKLNFTFDNYIDQDRGGFAVSILSFFHLCLELWIIEIFFEGNRKLGFGNRNVYKSSARILKMVIIIQLIVLITEVMVIILVIIEEVLEMFVEV